MDLHDKETYYGDQYKNAWTDFQRRRRTFYDPFDSFSEGGSHFGYSEKEKAALIIPVLESSSGAPVTSLKSAKIVETSATVLE